MSIRQPSMYSPHVPKIERIDLPREATFQSVLEVRCPALDMVCKSLPFSSVCTFSVVNKRTYHLLRTPESGSEGMWISHIIKEVNDAGEAALPRIRTIVKNALWRAYQFKWKLSSTHYSFLHGIAGHWAVFNKVSLRLQQLANPRADWTHRRFALPWWSSSGMSVKGIKGVKEFVDNNYPGQLLSVSPNFCEVRYSESALSLFIYNHNVTTDVPFVVLLEKFLSLFPHIQIDEEKEVSLYNEFEMLLKQETEERLSEGAGGMLVVISVPKEIVLEQEDSQSRVYRSHAFGKVCFCHDDSERERLLEAFHTDHNKQHYLCKEGDNPQFRIIMHKSILPQILSDTIEGVSEELHRRTEERIEKFVSKIMNYVGSVSSNLAPGDLQEKEQEA